MRVGYGLGQCNRESSAGDIWQLDRRHYNTSSASTSSRAYRSATRQVYDPIERTNVPRRMTVQDFVYVKTAILN